MENNLPKLRVLGIDVGTAIVGWSILEKDVGSKFNPIAYGTITTDAKEKMDHRLVKIADGIDELIEEFKPNHMAVESLFFFKNQKTVISVSQARGVIIVTGAKKGIQIYDYTPLQVKTAVTGYGRAEKKQVQKMVKLILGLEEAPKPDDVADAIAIAICHLNTFKHTLN